LKVEQLRDRQDYVKNNNDFERFNERYKKVNDEALIAFTKGLELFELNHLICL